MRSLFFLTFVVESYSLCGKGSVDLSGMAPFEVNVDCPGNRDKAGIEMGCVDVRTEGFNGDAQIQKSNIFYINPCGETTRDECKNKNIPAGAAGLEVTRDINIKNEIDTNCYSLGGKANPKFELIDEDNEDEG